MPRDYDREYTSEDTSDYKRKRRNDDESTNNEQGSQEIQNTTTHDAPPLNEKTAGYLDECLQEKKQLDPNKYTVCKKLLDDGEPLNLSRFTIFIRAQSSKYN